MFVGTKLYESKNGAYSLTVTGPSEWGTYRYKATHRGRLFASGDGRLAEIEARIERGHFQPDANKTPLTLKKVWRP